MGITNCSWTSCRHGCTSEIFKCWHLEVNFSLVSGSRPIPPPWASLSSLTAVNGDAPAAVGNQGPIPILSECEYKIQIIRTRACLRIDKSISKNLILVSSIRYSFVYSQKSGNWFRAQSTKLARLYPNVKGCGYPPKLQCEGNKFPEIMTDGPNDQPIDLPTNGRAYGLKVKFHFQ